MQFIPDFVKHAKKRIKELDAELHVMPKLFADDNQRWNAFREVLSDVRDGLKDMISLGSDGTGCGEDLAVVPKVTDVYRKYAGGILEVNTHRAQDALRVTGLLLVLF